MNRKVKIHLSEKFMDAVAGSATEGSMTKANSCIGYLATWAIGSKRYGGECTIYGSDEGNIYATYRNKDGEVTYYIAGIRHEGGGYTTHS